MTNTLLDTDLYKLTMQQAVFHNFPAATARYEFVCRNKGVNLLPLKELILDEISRLCSLSFSPEDISYLNNLKLFDPSYLLMLRNFRLPAAYVEVCEKKKELSISIEGPWLHTILFEVPILSAVNEIFFSKVATGLKPFDLGLGNLRRKLFHMEKNATNNFKLMEFGTRRRFSWVWQSVVINELCSLNEKKEGWKPLIGTSNVAFAKQFGLTPLGTMAHEWLQAFQVLSPLQHCQRTALETWMLEYRGRLGIALTDCLGTEAFLEDFDLLLAKAYDGVRQDSGDPYVWCHKMTEHYKRLGIDPRTKQYVFSDGLTVEKAVGIANTYKSQELDTVFGVGTSLTNDVGFEPLNIVIKMTHLNGMPVAKISDSPGKVICKDQEYLAHLKKTFGV